MKKILVLLSFIAFFFSCTKESTLPEPEKLVEVSFQMNLLGEGIPIVRALNSDQVQEALTKTLPEYYSLELTNTRSGNIYKVQDTRVPVRIPAGTYTVKGSNTVRFWVPSTSSSNGYWYDKGMGISCDNSKYRMWHGGGPLLEKGPKIYVEESTLEITQSGEYKINVSFNSCALIWDGNKVQKVRGYSLGWYDIVCAFEYENLRMVFLTTVGSWTGALKVELTPVAGENAETTTYLIKSSGFEYGKYYELKCNEVSIVEASGTVNYLTSWEEGQLQGNE